MKVFGADFFNTSQSSTNDSGLSCHLAWQGFHEIWMPDTWQGTGLPNRTDPG